VPEVDLILRKGELVQFPRSYPPSHSFQPNL
jgi:hypothetical protein